MKWFIEPHPTFLGTEESIFTPKMGLRINFWLEGGFKIEGENNEIEINFIALSIGLLVLVVRTNDDEQIIRIPFDRIIAFEIKPNKNIDNELSGLLRFGGDRKN